MAKPRSPNYPAIGLKEAIEHIRKIHVEEHMNEMPRDVVAKHMGYKSLNGTSMPMVSALSKYGLLEGRGDQTRVSELARSVLFEQGEEKQKALKRAAFSPTLFEELRTQFPERVPSEQNLVAYLQKHGFRASAADAVSRTYRDTLHLVTRVESEHGGDEGDHPNVQNQGTSHHQETQSTRPVMEGERVVFTHEVEPGHGIRVIACGAVDAEVLGALEMYIKLGRDRLKREKKTQS